MANTPDLPGREKVRASLSVLAEIIHGHERIKVSEAVSDGSVKSLAASACGMIYRERHLNMKPRRLYRDVGKTPVPEKCLINSLG